MWREECCEKQLLLQLRGPNLSHVSSLCFEVEGKFSIVTRDLPFLPDFRI